MNVELIASQIVQFAPQIPDETIHVGIEEFHEFRLYNGITLRDALDEIDEDPELWEELHPQDICNEIGCEEDYQTLLEQPLSMISRLFLETFLRKKNQLTIDNYENSIVNGEESLHGLVSFDDMSEGKKHLEALKSTLEDYSGRQMREVLSENNLETYADEIFYILKLVTYY
jgi:hypothetical protein